jgi:8-oxo-dGTP pyrophosphatase MutT (NUDIX family)
VRAWLFAQAPGFGARKSPALLCLFFGNSSLECRCIPFRFVGDARSPSSVRVLLITSSGGNGWVFPKGGWELDETAESAAVRETLEEGGVRGDLDPAVLGTYDYSNRKTSPTRKGCIAHMYAMCVREELSVWPESHHRVRGWVCSTSNCKCIARVPTVSVKAVEVPK